MSQIKTNFRLNLVFVPPDSIFTVPFAPRNPGRRPGGRRSLSTLRFLKSAPTSTQPAALGVVGVAAMMGVTGLFLGCEAGLGFGNFTRQGFDFGDVLRMSLAVTLTRRTDLRRMGVDVAAAEQHAEVSGDGAVGGGASCRSD